MRNLVLHLAFDGTRYHGWQVQANAATVQQTLQDAFERVFARRLPVAGCSRTDAGVHARDFVCSFRTDARIACENVVRALNANLPPDIAVLSCAEAPEDFHARYSARGKEYVYEIWNAPVRSPFLRGRAFFYPCRLDEARLSALAAPLLGRHDFGAFRAAGSDTGARPPVRALFPAEPGVNAPGGAENTPQAAQADETAVRTLYEAAVTREGDLVRLRVRGDGFLYNMVRIIAGTLLFAARTPGYDVGAVLASRSRALAGPTAPAHGLYLNRVFY